MARLPRIVAVVGATATGKTALGEAMAHALGGEVVCADSRQVFRELEIGTGKPDPEERRAQPHHLFDALALGEHASAGWYARAAAETCRAVWSRGAVPVLVGGSGLYVRALQHGLAAMPERDPEIRGRLAASLEAEGVEALYARLAEVDAETAARLEPRDVQRVTRALEVLEVSGRPLSWWLARPTAPPIEADWRVVELTLEPDTLAARIAARTRWMFAHGLVEETAELVESGHREALVRLSAIGYDEALAVIEGRLGRAAAEEEVDTRTRQLAKRQRTWFRHQIEARRLEGADTMSAGLLAAALETAGG